MSFSSLTKCIKLSVAGSGKTYWLCNEALNTIRENPAAKVLITTFTNENIKTIKTELAKQNGGVVPKNVDVMTWFRFLLRHMIKPYQSCISGVGVNEIRTLSFAHKKVNYGSKGTRRRYVDVNDDVLVDYVDEMACEINMKSGGKAISRLTDIYDVICIDEIQDTCGRDLDLLELIIDSEVGFVGVGDSKQATLRTHLTSINRKLSGKNLDTWAETLESEGKISVIHENASRRFNAMICHFANAIYPEGISMTTVMKEVTGHDGVFLISSEDAIIYEQFYKPIVLRYDKNSDTLGLPAINYGVSKGDTFDRVLIFPNGKLEDYLLKGKQLKSPCKYYVAMTRPRYSIAVVVDKMPISLDSYVAADIKVGKGHIRGLKYCV